MTGKMSNFRANGLPTKTYLRKLIIAGLLDIGYHGGKFMDKDGNVYWVTGGMDLRRVESISDEDL